MAMALAATEAEAERLRVRISKLEQGLQDSYASVRNLKTEIAAYEAELGTKMEQTLSDLELKEVDDLNAETDKTKKALVQLSKHVAEVRPSAFPFTPNSQAELRF